MHLRLMGCGISIYWKGCLARVFFRLVGKPKGCTCPNSLCRHLQYHDRRHSVFPENSDFMSSPRIERATSLPTNALAQC